MNPADPNSTVTLEGGEVLTVAQLEAEYVRVRAWAGACCGEDVAKVGGLPF